MKQTLIAIASVNLLVVCSMHATEKLNADVHLRVTSELPKWKSSVGYDGVISITNTGQSAFVVVTDEEWSRDAIRFYRTGTEEQQLIERQLGNEERRERSERFYVMDAIDFCLESNKAHKKLQPGESISFECKNFHFAQQFSTPSSIYKAEMYLGEECWIPVHITPTLGTLMAVSWKKGVVEGDLYYSMEGTNQYLYLKDGEKFKRVAEMKLGTTPRYKEGAVSLISSDGSTNEITRTAALQLIQKK